MFKDSIKSQTSGKPFNKFYQNTYFYVYSYIHSIHFILIFFYCIHLLYFLLEVEEELLGFQIIVSGPWCLSRIIVSRSTGERQISAAALICQGLYMGTLKKEKKKMKETSFNYHANHELLSFVFCLNDGHTMHDMLLVRISNSVRICKSKSISIEKSHFVKFNVI